MHLKKIIEEKHGMKIIHLLILTTLLSLGLYSACSKEASTPTAPAPVNDSESMRLAQEGFALLNTKLQALRDTDYKNLTAETPVISEADYNAIKTKFTQALVQNPQNPLANLGMAVVEIVSINYDETLWSLFGEIDMSFARKRLLNNQANFFAQSPTFYLKYCTTALEVPSITFAYVQQHIETSVLPKISSALSHLNYAVTLADSNALRVDTGEEMLELDKGEIYLFRASIYLIDAAFQMMMLYDLDLIDRNGTYQWVDTYETLKNAPSEESSYRTQTISAKNWLFLNYYLNRSNAKADSLLMDNIKYNVQTRSGFLSYRTGKSGLTVKNDLTAFLQDLENSVTSITSETDDQTNDIIKLSYITDLNTELAIQQTGIPNFTQSWTSITAIIQWFKSLLSSPYTFNEPILPQPLQIDMSKLFSPGLPNLKIKLPYHRWMPEQMWITVDTVSEVMPNFGAPFGFWMEPQGMITVQNVDFVSMTFYTYENAGPVEFLNGPNGSVIGEEEPPYLPDYTFNGLFPGMTRDMFYMFFGGSFYFSSKQNQRFIKKVLK
jgi:hypothetical protein